MGKEFELDRLGEKFELEVSNLSSGIRVFQFSIWRSLKVKSPLPWANGLERKFNIVRNDTFM